ncbi:hypothetical protein QFZ54_001330 [Sphingomonas faeni]|nr:hypothetical protein [Sphingomonas faeni]
MTTLSSLFSREGGSPVWILAFAGKHTTVAPSGLTPPLPVILTKVRIQGSKRKLSWLWILTFVRMTEKKPVRLKTRYDPSALA